MHPIESLLNAHLAAIFSVRLNCIFFLSVELVSYHGPGQFLVLSTLICALYIVS